MFSRLPGGGLGHLDGEFYSSGPFHVFAECFKHVQNDGAVIGQMRLMDGVQSGAEIVGYPCVCC